MKPLALTMTGFRSYTATTRIDFTGKSLAAVIGNTGAGKSSILEAVTYALYGRCSWDKVVQPLMADGVQAMEVELVFSHDGTRWRVHRSLRAGAKSTTAGHGLENLDTGEKIDNSTAVTDRIKALLHMDYATFESVVLLPQGRFDKLLSATGSERTAMLQQLFGAQDLIAAREAADRRGRAVNALLADAREARARLLPDPAARAHEARLRAAAADEQAGRLGAALTAMTAARQAATGAAARGAAAHQASQELARAAVADAHAVIGGLAPLAARLQAVADEAARQCAAARDRGGAALEQIRTAAEEGRSIADLRAAAAVVNGLPERVADLDAQARQIHGERIRLEKQGAEISGDVTSWDERRRAVADAVRAGQDAGRIAETVRAAADVVRDRIARALGAAEQSARVAGALAAAVDQLDARDQGLPGCRREYADAEQALGAAEQDLSGLQTRMAAAAIAAHLAGGEDCPVCSRPLPAGYEPPHSAEAHALDAAQQVRSAAADRFRRAGRALDAATAGRDAAVAAVAAREADLERAGQDLDAALGAGEQAYADLVAAIPADSTANSAADLEPVARFGARLRGASRAVAGAAGGGSARSSEAEAEAGIEAGPETGTSLTARVQAVPKALADRAEEAKAAAAALGAELAAAEKDLARRRDQQARETAALNETAERHEKAIGAYLARVADMPACGRTLLPGGGMAVTRSVADAAVAALRQRFDELEILERDHEDARQEAEAHRADQEAAEAEVRSRVEAPLRGLQRRLESWAQAIDRAAEQAQVPTADALEPPDQGAECPTPDAVERYADRVAAAADRLAAVLGEQSRTCAAAEDRARAELAAQARGLAGPVDGGDVSGPGVDGSDPDVYAYVHMDADGDLTAEGALNPLIAAADAARRDAERSRGEHDTAYGQIRPAAHLDVAIEAGQARYAALEEVRRHLANAKFPAFLTAKRTGALLGIASEILRQLTDGRFGFAADFKIVSCGSGVVHGAERLSGGEKFLASLALALALVELHSRGGPRLGALFLDEGFAALDATALDVALSVLRDQAGGDRLVMAISHVHAVAEAVDDVLWVEKGGAGSTARWMTAAERDGLAQMDGTSGLVALT